jgi:hypothetical protein
LRVGVKNGDPQLLRGGICSLTIADRRLIAYNLEMKEVQNIYLII